MQIANIHKAKTHFSQLIKRAEMGEEIIICKASIPAVKLVKFVPSSSSSPRKPGIWKDQIKIAEDFDDLPPKLLAAFKGEQDELFT
jgi:antitoxin (DNA-binding transcriptional repressor) of toxin-antitoxin stability system